MSVSLKLQTAVEIPNFKWKTGYGKKNIFLGSCFTENVGNHLANLKFDADINPFGILYNPVSIASGLKLLLQNKTFQKEDLIEHAGLWHSFFHHGRFSSPDANQTLQKINERMEFSSCYLKEADFLFITFGTSWVYEFKKTGRIVSNCHKIPNNEFSRYRISAEKISAEYFDLLPEIWKLNPELKVVFTVSPIRHWKDGAIENQRSKSELILAIDKIIRTFGTDRCNYFPAYEIVMDELRDYRFYSDDMIHISDVAVNYIRNHFQHKLMDEESLKISKEVQKIINAVNHKPINQFTTETSLFFKNTLKKINELEQFYPFVYFDLEKQFLTEQINETEANYK